MITEIALASCTDSRISRQGPPSGGRPWPIHATWAVSLSRKPTTLHDSAVKGEVEPGGVIILGEPAVSGSAKEWAVKLVENTAGVSAVADEPAADKPVKV